MDSPLSTGFSHLNWSFPTFQGWATLHQLRPTPRLHEGTQPRYRSAIVPSLKLGQAPIFFEKRKKLQKKQQPQKVWKAGKGQLCVLCRDILCPWIFWCIWVLQSAPTQRPAVVLPTPGKFLQFQVPTLRCLFRLKLRYAIYRYHF